LYVAAAVCLKEVEKFQGPLWGEGGVEFTTVRLGNCVEPIVIAVW
jgi:hypothetical protein